MLQKISSKSIFSLAVRVYFGIRCSSRILHLSVYRNAGMSMVWGNRYFVLDLLLCVGVANDGEFRFLQRNCEAIKKKRKKNIGAQLAY